MNNKYAVLSWKPRIFCQITRLQYNGGPKRDPMNINSKCHWLNQDAPNACHMDTLLHCF